MDLSRERQCGNKTKHKKKTGANAHKFRLVQQGSAVFRLHVYRCDHCRHWHVGHGPHPDRRQR